MSSPKQPPSPKPSSTEIRESAITILAEGSRIDGNFKVEKLCRLHGIVVGKVSAAPGSVVVLAENSLVEGDIEADTLFVDGFVRGNIRVTGKIVISGTGRVIGNIEGPCVRIDFGAHFEGKCLMEATTSSP